MGNKSSAFKEAQLEAYQDCTYFTRQDILRIFKRFKDLTQTGDRRTFSQNEKLPLEKLLNMPELKENPFRRRICEVFSQNNSGELSFDEFLNMFSVFSEAAPREIKAVYAFKIYDFDRDNQLNRSDLYKTLQALTFKSARDQNDMTDAEEDNQNQTSLDVSEINHILDKVFEETDLDNNGLLSYIEFEHVISRAPDFLTTFHIRI